MTERRSPTRAGEMDPAEIDRRHERLEEFRELFEYMRDL